MIKRAYFISGEIYRENGTKTVFFRHFWHRSILANPSHVLEIWQKKIAFDNGVEVVDLAITAFNRC